MGEEEEQQQKPASPIRPEIPISRVKKIMKLDKDINKINSEALFLVTCSTQLFLNFLAQQSAQAASEKKRKTVKLDHLRLAVKRHKPSNEFLLDSLPLPPSLVPDKEKAEKKAKDVAPVPGSHQRIDSFFKKKAVKEERESSPVNDKDE